MQSIVEKFKDNLFENLRNIPRWGGTPVVKTETDADHVISVQAMVLQMLVVDPCIRYEINIKEACYRALLHDLDEAAGGSDVPRCLKYHDKNILNAIKSAQSAMMREHGWSEELCMDIDESKDNTPEGRVIAFFDTLQAFFKMQEELALGNSYMKSQLPNVIAFLENFDYGVLADGNHEHTRELLQELKYYSIEYCKENGVVNSHTINFSRQQ